MRCDPTHISPVNPVEQLLTLRSGDIYIDARLGPILITNVKSRYSDSIYVSVLLPSGARDERWLTIRGVREGLFTFILRKK